ncbi:L-type lectin-domain containing receptor kinase VIII.1-like [Mercurialis annua]|uniref:L-type lectin-domain containing receptor kinase VIII.1-like n=1 Tax=Mercurialis annua TaxID=3986 RepID=UPI0021603EE5|nr:L-type lectin-domain containing receptor kinase VIII.1-like [Mercurialis annua]
MASNCLFGLIFLIFHFKLLSADQISAFSFQSFGKDSNFESSVGLYGDAKAVRNGSVLQLADSVSYSGGRVMYKKPVKVVEGKNLVSFSSYLAFSMSSGNGDGLSFVMVSGGFNVSKFGDRRPFGVSLRSVKNNSEFVAVEFGTRLDKNHVGINVGGFVSSKVKNGSFVNLVLNNGKRLSSWIDYEAGSKRLEVRISHFGDRKPIDPWLNYPIDLSKLWKNGKFYVGLSSSNGNSSQTSSVYSWTFEQRRVPRWMHSQPLDPQAFVKDAEPIGVVNKRSNCLLRVLAAMIFGTACGAFGAFCVLYLWSIFGNRRPVVPEECAMHPVDFEYKKVVEKAVEDGKQ